MDNLRFKKGKKMLYKIDGTGGKEVINSLKDIAPDLGKYIIEFAFGDIYTRGGLTLKEREMITIVSLLSMGGAEPQLKVHIHAALNVGIPKENIIEAFMQCIPYAGFPRVLNGVNAAREVFEKK